MPIVNLFTLSHLFPVAALGVAPQAGNIDTMVGRWLSDPLTRRLGTMLIGLILIVVIVRLLQRALSRAIKDTDARYRARKAATFLGYQLAFFLIAATFSDRMGG